MLFVDDYLVLLTWIGWFVHKGYVFSIEQPHNSCDIAYTADKKLVLSYEDYVN